MTVDWLTLIAEGAKIVPRILHPPQTKTRVYVSTEGKLRVQVNPSITKT